MTRTCFINCGYGLTDLTRLAAIELAVWDAGLQPRLDANGPALTTSPRSGVILTALDACDRSVHDLALSRGTGRYQHSRSNMVYEAALAIARAPSNALVTFPLGYRVERSLFDLFGGEPPTVAGRRDAHEGQPAMCAYRTIADLHAFVQGWLSETPTAPQGDARVLAYRDALTERARGRPITHRQHPRFRLTVSERQAVYQDLNT